MGELPPSFSYENATSLAEGGKVSLHLKADAQWAPLRGAVGKTVVWIKRRAPHPPQAVPLPLRGRLKVSLRWERTVEDAGPYRSYFEIRAGAHWAPLRGAVEWIC